MTEEKQFNDELEQNPSEEQKVTDENPASAEDQLSEEPVDVAETHEEPQETIAQEVVPEKTESPVAEDPIIEEPAIDEPASEEIINEETINEATTNEATTNEEPAPVVEAEKISEPPEFDWELTSKKHESYTKAERERLEDIYGKTLSSINEHEVILGTVVAISNREVVVNIGFKSDGIIPLNEVRYNPDLKIGDEIEVYVESQEDTTGQLMLSHRKARILRSWERVNNAFETDEIIKGYVKSRTKGGLIVDVFGIEAFLPGSQIDVKPIRDYDIYVDKVMEFKVVKINHEYKNVVVSHKALIEDELEQQRAEIIAKLEKGQVLEGLVKNITSYGVFVDMGGVDGLVHITDLSWGRINHPNEVVELDQKIKVAILDFDESKKRIALGLKQLTPHPWDSLDPDLKVGDKVEGRVVVLADYGAFVEIAPGVEGLIHVSEMSWSQHLRTAQDFMKVDDKVEAVILTLSREERKMSLGIKQLIPDPWENILVKYPINSKHTALVRNFTNFGIFVELEEGVDGLIHISDLSWSKKIKHPAEFTKVGEEMEVVVLDIDVENRRLSLGHKQLEENPWDVFETVFTPGSIHKGTIQAQADKGMIVTLPYGVEGFAPLRHLAKEDNTTAKVDETLDFKVIEFSKENKKIILSHSRVYQDAQVAERTKERTQALTDEEATRRTVRRLQDNIEKTTLGDITALAKMKSDLEKSEKAERKSKAASKSKKDEEEAESQVEEGTEE